MGYGSNAAKPRFPEVDINDGTKGRFSFMCQA